MTKMKFMMNKTVSRSSSHMRTIRMKKNKETPLKADTKNSSSSSKKNPKKSSSRLEMKGREIRRWLSLKESIGEASWRSVWNYSKTRKSLIEKAVAGLKFYIRQATRVWAWKSSKWAQRPPCAPRSATRPSSSCMRQRMTRMVISRWSIMVRSKKRQKSEKRPFTM